MRGRHGWDGVLNQMANQINTGPFFAEHVGVLYGRVAFGARILGSGLKEDKEKRSIPGVHVFGVAWVACLPQELNSPISDGILSAMGMKLVYFVLRM